jgi:hypothetical protein
MRDGTKTVETGVTVCHEGNALGLGRGGNLDLEGDIWVIWTGSMFVNTGLRSQEIY